MLGALLRAIGNLAAPPVRRVAALCLVLAAVVLLLLWLAAALALGHWGRFGWQPLDWAVEILGSIAALFVAWLLYPAAVTLVFGFFLDRVAGAVESLDYPGCGPSRLIPLSETIITTLRLMGLTIMLNLLALPVYVLMPGLNFFVFFGLNGYLFGREYFEVVALRRLAPTGARALRRRFAGRVFAAGVAIAGLFAVPLVNLVAPVIATAFMVHLLAGLRPALPQPFA